MKITARSSHKAIFCGLKITNQKKRWCVSRKNNVRMTCLQHKGRWGLLSDDGCHTAWTCGSRYFARIFHIPFSTVRDEDCPDWNFSDVHQCVCEHMSKDHVWHPVLCVGPLPSIWKCGRGLQDALSNQGYAPERSQLTKLTLKAYFSLNIGAIALYSPIQSVRLVLPGL